MNIYAELSLFLILSIRKLDNPAFIKLENVNVLRSERAHHEAARDRKW
jgi:hypothetical protein